MMKTAKMIPLLLVTFLAAPVFAQSTATEVKRDVNQQQRIENGLKSGQLNTREVAKLERGQARVDTKEAVAGRDGHVSAAEQARVQRTENRQSRRIRREKHDDQHRG